MLSTDEFLTSSNCPWRTHATAVPTEGLHGEKRGCFTTTAKDISSLTSPLLLFLPPITTSLSLVVSCSVSKPGAAVSVNSLLVFNSLLAFLHLPFLMFETTESVPVLIPKIISIGFQFSFFLPFQLQTNLNLGRLRTTFL